MPIDIAAGLVLTKNALDIVKAVRDALRQKKLSPEEMRDYLDTLQDKLVDVKTALSDADDENRQVKREIADLKALLSVRASVIPAEGTYWTRKPTGRLGH